MEIKEILLRPQTPLLKVFFIPFLAFIGFGLYVFLRGFGSNRYESTNPVSMQWGTPLWLVLILALLLFVIINLIIKIYSASDIEEGAEIRIENNKLIIERHLYQMVFDRDKLQKINISISWFWGLFFQKFYRIGKLKIKYQNDTYTFLFPVRDMDLEKTINDQSI